MRRRLRCCVTGSADLTVECAQLLLAAGLSIEVIASTSEQVRSWARHWAIATLASPEQLETAGIDVDYLFSVVNGSILPPAVLRLARRLAINYHNGPLPRYAGVHAASWAILNDEPGHGMTWHVMNERIDAGDIVRQATFPVPPRATAWDVNRTCRRLALSTLAAVVDDIVAGTVRARPQDLSRRTYFAGRRRAPDGGLIRWDLPAARIDRLVRAHQVGPVVNSFGSATVLLGDPDGGSDATAVVAEVEPVTGPPSDRPGTIIDVGSGAVRVATADADLLLPELVQGSGARRPAAELLREHGYGAGDRLPLPDGRFAARLERALSDAAVDEPACAAAIAAAGVSGASGRATAALDSAGCEVAVPPELRDLLTERWGRLWPGPAVAAAVLLLLRRGTPARRVSVGLCTAAQRDRTRGLSAFLCAVYPITVDLDDAASLRSLVHEMERSIATAARCGVHPHHLPIRYKIAAGSGAGPALPAVVVLDGDDVPEPPRAGGLAVVVPGSGDRLRLAVTAVGGGSRFGRGPPSRVAADLLAGLRLLSEPDHPIGAAHPPAGGAGAPA